MTQKTIKLYYQGKGRNFGDAINYDIFNSLFNCNVVASRPYTADCMAIGSVLSKVLYDTNKHVLARKNLKKTFSSILMNKQPIHILGSGFIEDVRKTYPKLKLFRPVNLVALRGRLTREIIEEITGKPLDTVPLGDLGLLVSEFIKEETIAKKYKLGIIPHIVDKQSPIITDLEKESGVTIIDIESPPLDFLRKVAACETIASTTLHGLITADSLHIPNAWIRLSDGLLGGDFKFLDYYSAYNQTACALDLRSSSPNELSCEFIQKNYTLTTVQVEKLKTKIYDTIEQFVKINYL